MCVCENVYLCIMRMFARATDVLYEYAPVDECVSMCTRVLRVCICAQVA